MISLRYHAVSIAAVFLALAVGVCSGRAGCPTGCSRPTAPKADGLDGQVQALTAERDALVAAQRAADEFAARLGPAAVRGVLQGKRVAFVTVGADPADRDALERAGRGRRRATVTGEVALTPAVGDPARADQLRELTSQLLPTGAQLPAASDTGSLVGGLLGGVLLGSGSEDPSAADAVLTGLTAAGFVAPGDQPEPADLVLVLTGGALTGVDAGDAAAVTRAWPPQLDRAGGPAPCWPAGPARPTPPAPSAWPGPTRRSPPTLSTVDDVQTGAGGCRRCWRCASSSTGGPGATAPR